jgi:hypothetical protein
LLKECGRSGVSSISICEGDAGESKVGGSCGSCIAGGPLLDVIYGTSPGREAEQRL